MNENTDKPEPKQRFHGDRTIVLHVTQDEYDLMNWCRTRHRPARLYQWAKDVLIEAARNEVRYANQSGGKVPQGVNEICDRLKPNINRT